MSRTIPFVPQPLFSYKNSFELVAIMGDAIAAHQAYYEAGVLHGHIAPQNIMLVRNRLAGEEQLKGILIDLDSAVDWEKQPSRQCDPDKQNEKEPKDEKIQ